MLDAMSILFKDKVQKIFSEQAQVELYANFYEEELLEKPTLVFYDYVRAKNKKLTNRQVVRLTISYYTLKNKSD